MSEYQQLWFVTLTYHSPFADPSFSATHDLNCFLQFIRDNYPHMQYIWRLEFQKRGVPHYHLILFNPKHLPTISSTKLLRQLTDVWHHIADPESNDHQYFGLKLTAMADYRQAFAYCSKYQAKAEENNLYNYKGRRWAVSRGLSLRPVLSLEVPASVYMLIRSMVATQLTNTQKISEKFALYLSDCYSCHVYMDIDTFLDCYNKSFNFVSRKKWKPILESLWLSEHLSEEDFADTSKNFFPSERS